MGDITQYTAHYVPTGGRVGRCYSGLLLLISPQGPLDLGTSQTLVLTFYTLPGLTKITTDYVGLFRERKSLTIVADHDNLFYWSIYII